MDSTVYKYVYEKLKNILKEYEDVYAALEKNEEEEKVLSKISLAIVQTNLFIDVFKKAIGIIDLQK